MTFFRSVKESSVINFDFCSSVCYDLPCYMHFETTSESEDFFQVAANSFSRNWLIFVIIFFLLIENLVRVLDMLSFIFHATKRMRKSSIPMNMRQKYHRKIRAIGV